MQGISIESNSKRESKIPQKLFTPIKIRTMEVKNRLCFPAVAGLSKLDRTIPEEFKDFFLTRARGGAGMIVLPGVDFTYLEVPPESSATERLMRETQELVATVHEFNVRIGIQLHHSGRQLTPISPSSYEAVAASPISWSPRSPIPRELSVEEIEGLVDRYVRAAIRVKEAGFDFVEVKACHGYLLSNFLSPHSNRRTDDYGGELRRRARFTLEVINRIKQELGDELLICCRFNGSDHIKGGLNLTDAQALAPLIVEAGADFLSITAGVYGSYPVIVPPSYSPHGCLVHLAEGVKSVVSVPVITVGRINDPWMAEDILNAGKADIVAMGRALIADPDLPSKASKGEFNSIRKCIGCNQGCQDRKPGQRLSCLVNPAAGREQKMEIIRAPVSKKVLVVGAGPAGLEAARVAALRGHRVTIYEEEDEVGGQWKLAAIPPHKQEFNEFVAYQLRQIRKLGIEIRLGKRFTAEEVDKEKPDSVIVATGAIPLIPSIPGVERDNVTTAWDILAGKSKAGYRVLVVGGNAVGVETADFLATLRKKVTVIEMLEHWGTNLGPTVRWHLKHRLAKLGVQILTSTKIEAISRDSVLVRKGQGQEIWNNFDTIVLACGARSRRELVQDFKNKGEDIYIIGDAANPRNGLDAICEGAELGRKV